MVTEDYLAQLVRADNELVVLRHENQEYKEMTEYQRAKINKFDEKLQKYYADVENIQNENKL